MTVIGHKNVAVAVDAGGRGDGGNGGWLARIGVLARQ